jgi:hypothetical protein
MQNKIIRFITITITVLATIAAVLPGVSQAADKTSSSSPPKPAEQGKRSDRLPFHGKLNAVDKAAMTLTLEGKEKKRVIQITAQTRIMKAGKPATLGEAIVGEEVAGQAIKTGDGKEEALSVRLGAKVEETPKDKPVKKEKAREK